MTATMILCYARNRPKNSTTVHSAVEGDDRALCGVMVGAAAPDAAVSCWTCRETLNPPTPPSPASEDDQAVLAAAEEALHQGPPLAHIQICDRHAHVLVEYNTLLIAIVRRIPGARWDKPNKAWIIPAALADRAAERLRNAGAEVTSEILP